MGRKGEGRGSERKMEEEIVNRKKAWSVECRGNKEEDGIFEYKKNIKRCVQNIHLPYCPISPNSNFLTFPL